MTEPEKQLLLQDLCSRLLCGVTCRFNFTYSNETTFGEEVENEVDDTISMVNTKRDTVFADYLGREFDIECVKPYLRPMSSMTEEEVREFYTVENITPHVGYISPTQDWHFTIYGIDWLNKHHFDYRGLIEKHLAIEVDEINNPYDKL